MLTRALGAAAFATVALAPRCPDSNSVPGAARGARTGVVAGRQAPRLLLPQSHLALGARRQEWQGAAARDGRHRARPRVVARRSLDRLCRRIRAGLRPRRRPRANGGDVRRLTTLPGDERWPSWTPMGASCSRTATPADGGCRSSTPAGGQPTAALRLTPPRRRAAGPLVAGREARRLRVRSRQRRRRSRSLGGRSRTRAARSRRRDRGWLASAASKGFLRGRPTARGSHSLPSARGWVASGSSGCPTCSDPRPRGPRLKGMADPLPRLGRPRRAPATLVSRHGGAPSWSPDGKRLAIADLPPPDLSYNGNPERNDRRAAAALRRG